ncbi:hypothetical protein LHK20_03730 [Staphylococcus argenteus]|nr:hypothetical protein [Staphylococcus argenteus]MCG9821310.1 hypothetical protein [Staphylococcus argenteus]MCG9830066.1 hypothetical protein [Staphylococcus argenteus]
MKEVDSINRELDDLVKTINKEISFIEDNIIILSVFKKLNEFVNFIEIKEHLKKL